MTGRQIVIVDVETSGLRYYDVATEVSWENLDTGDHATFIPRHPVDWVLRNGQPTALEMTGYATRIAPAQQDTGRGIAALYEQLRGHCLAGANPAFDWYGHLRRLFQDCGLTAQPHHHRLPDVENYTAGVLGLDPRAIPGLAGCCDLLDVAAPDHTARGDVVATAACFRRLAQIQADRRDRGELAALTKGRT